MIYSVQRNSKQTSDNHRRLTVLKYLPASLTLLVLLTITRLTSGQDKNIIKGNMQWVQYYNQLSFGDRWSWLTDGGYRLDDFFRQGKQILLRTGAGYSLNPDLRITAGLAYLNLNSPQSIKRTEFRPYQEFLLRNNYNSFSFSHRYRLEERFYFYPEQETDNKLLSFNLRFRYAIMARIPLLKLSKKHTDRKLILSIGNEIFINAGKKIIHNIFDQNRFLISPGIQFSRNFSVHCTWTSMFSATGSPNIYRYTNLFWIQIKHKLQLRSKEALLSDKQAIFTM